MNVMPALTHAALIDPAAYIATLRDALVKLKRGASHVRTSFGDEYLNFRAEDTDELRSGIVRLISLNANGQLGARPNDIDNPMPWLRAP